MDNSSSQNGKVSSEKAKKQAEDLDEAKSEQSKVPINIDPEEARFAHSGGKSEHVIVNFTTNRMAIKVRCGNASYRIEPTHMIVEPGKCRQLNIIRLPGPVQTDKVFVQYIECDASATDAKIVFKNAEAAGTKINNIKIKLIAAAAGGRKMSREIVEE
ncbi:unnamed protein product [Caenorhabditis angaria]|uniref:Major sperm protein n=1 Tax=Caenorhabditis angaria TaxID=860376 RepID=A0A9P1N010_9PELO|nr:unnamed protein product [Caenorhabditis angaria]